MFGPQGCLPRAGPHHKGVHARGDHHRPALARGVRPRLLQSVRPHAPQQTEEAAAPGAPVQPLRRTQRLEDIPRFQTTMKAPSCLLEDSAMSFYLPCIIMFFQYLLFN